MSEITELLVAAGQGNSEAQGRLVPLVYEELIRIARSRMAHERADHTFETADLVHEAYLRLFGKGASGQFDGRAHFFAAAAEAMRRILIEHARRKHAQKNGGGWHRVDPDDDLPAIKAPCDDLDDLLSLDDALNRLARESPESAHLVNLLYFGGLNLDEAAQVVGFSRTTAYRRWQFARAWLYTAISGEERFR